jgi:2-dehydro-3-deoxyglucarate aldolase/4-hydroxy-2-oxoheptanedioate aldolase
MMKENRLRRALRDGRIAVGHMVMEFGTRGIAQILAQADLDFVLIDMEHSGFGIERVADLIAWLKATEIAPIVRVPQNVYHFLATALDAGAYGVMVANVESAAEARTIVEAAKYTPLGRRGLGLTAAHSDFASPRASEYLDLANERTMIVCQIESPAGVEHADEIAAVEGIDVLWIGHNDLTTAMGIRDQFQHERFLTALRTVVEACRKHGKAAGIQPGNDAQTEQWVGLGFNAVSLRSDVALYREALKSVVARLKTATAASRPAVAGR